MTNFRYSLLIFTLSFMVINLSFASALPLDKFTINFGQNNSLEISNQVDNISYDYGDEVVFHIDIDLINVSSTFNNVSSIRIFLNFTSCCRPDSYYFLENLLQSKLDKFNLVISTDISFTLDNATMANSLTLWIKSSFIFNENNTISSFESNWVESNHLSVFFIPSTSENNSFIEFKTIGLLIIPILVLKKKRQKEMVNGGS